MGVLMSSVAPKARKHLSADALFGLVRNGFASIPDYRMSETDIALADALMAAFAMFSLKAPSLLAFDKERAAGHLRTIYGSQHVPCDTYRRERLDPVSPKVLRPVFTSVFRQLQRGKALEAMTFLDSHYLLALDGTAYFSSKTLPCASCLHKVHRNGSCTYDHQMLGAAIVHPDQRAVMPLMPEPIVKQEGTDKKQIPRSSRRNPLPVKRINGALLMGHEHVSRALVELMQMRKTPSGADRVLHDAPEAFDRIEVMPTMGW